MKNDDRPMILISIGVCILFIAGLLIGEYYASPEKLSTKSCTKQEPFKEQICSDGGAGGALAGALIGGAVGHAIAGAIVGSRTGESRCHEEITMRCVEYKIEEYPNPRYRRWIWQKDRK